MASSPPTSVFGVRRRGGALPVRGPPLPPPAAGGAGPGPTLNSVSREIGQLHYVLNSLPGKLEGITARQFHVEEAVAFVNVDREKVLALLILIFSFAILLHLSDVVPLLSGRILQQSISIYLLIYKRKVHLRTFPCHDIWHSSTYVSKRHDQVILIFG